MALLPSQEDTALAFAEVFTAIELVYARGGNPMLVRLTESLREGAGYEEAIGRSVGAPFSRFFADWKSYLGKRAHPKDALPLSAEKRRFTEDEAPSPAGQKTEEEREKIRFAYFLEIEDEQGRRLAHLGELLRARNRNKAAVEEFAKAYCRVGNRSPALSTRYAQALMKAGDLAKAEALLLASLEPFPDYVRTHRLLGQLFSATGRPAEAERAFLAVVAIDPFDPAPHAALREISAARQDEARSLRESDALDVLSGRAMPEQASTTEGMILVRSPPLRPRGARRARRPPRGSEWLPAPTSSAFSTRSGGSPARRRSRSPRARRRSMSRSVRRRRSLESGRRGEKRGRLRPRFPRRLFRQRLPPRALRRARHCFPRHGRAPGMPEVACPLD